MDIDVYKNIELEDCPYCGGTARLEEENGWCWYVICSDCGSQTGEFSFSDDRERIKAAEKAAYVWNIGKVIRAGAGE